MILYEIEKTPLFDKWFKKLKDNQAKARIGLRLKKVIQGHFGDHKQLNESLFELRFFFGAGYRVYYTIRNGKVILLLNGGDKGSQGTDIAKAQQMIEKLEVDYDH